MKLISVQSRGNRLATIEQTEHGRLWVLLKQIDQVVFYAKDVKLMTRRQRAFKAAAKWLEGATQ